MSGTFKASTIKSELIKDKKSLAVWSDIKPWKYYEKLANLEQNDLNYAALHLCKLKNYLYDIPNINNIDTLLIERGVSDMLFYKLNRPNNNITEDLINKILKEEYLLEEQNSYYEAEKILLIQLDIEFIRNVILKEKTRNECFPGGVEDYLKHQEKYIEYTKKYNNITNIIKIKDAKEYIEKNLGFEFNPELNF